MRFEVKETTPEPKFNPIEVTLVIETKEDLAQLWYRLDCNYINGREVYSNWSRDVWKQIDGIVRERALLSYVKDFGL